MAVMMQLITSSTSSKLPEGNKYGLAANEFSDMSPDEFAKTHFGYTKPEMPWGNLKNLGTHVYIVSHC
mgnify:CR=1 FL=1